MSTFEILIAEAQRMRDIATAASEKAVDSLANCNVAESLAGSIAAAPLTISATRAFAAAARAAHGQPPETRAHVAESTAAMAEACRCISLVAGAATGNDDMLRTATEAASDAASAAERLDAGGTAKAARAVGALQSHIRAATMGGRRWPPPVGGGTGGPGA